MSKQENKAVNFDDLTVGDEYLFGSLLLRDKEHTKQLIEKLIGIPDIEDIEFISVEDVHHNTYDNKGIRIDVYIKSLTGVAYIVELQRTNTREIEKRMRFYQSVSDSRQLPPGKEGAYKNLKDNYVIFICREDIFGKGLYKYSFENTCLELKDLKLNDGSYKIVFNTQGTKGDVCTTVLDFLRLIEGKSVNDPFIKLLEASAEEIKADEKWRLNYMQSKTWEQDNFDAGFDAGVEKGLEKGLEKGIEKEKIEMAKSLLADQLPIEFISKHTGLPAQEIEKLKEDLLN